MPRPSRPLSLTSAPDCILTPTQMEIFNLKQKYIYLTGAKASGKSIIPAIKALHDASLHSEANFVGITTTKGGASDKIGGALLDYQQMAITAEMISTPIFEMTAHQLRRRNYDTKGNTITVPNMRFASVDTINDDMASISTNGIRDKSFFSLCVWEELVQDKELDPSKILSWGQHDILRKKVDSSLSRHSKNKPTPLPATQHWFPCNPWVWNDPIVQRLELHIPNKEWLKWVMEDLENNHTQIHIVPEKDEAWIRTTVLASPVHTLEEREQLKKEITEAVNSNDEQALTYLLGCSFKSTGLSPYVFNTPKNILTPEPDLDYVIQGSTGFFSYKKTPVRLKMSIGVDWGYRDEFVITPVLEILDWGYRPMSLHILTTEIVPKIDGRPDLMTEQAEKMILDIHSRWNCQSMSEKYLFIDEMSGIWVSKIQNNPLFTNKFSTITKAFKNSHWDRKARTDWTRQSFEDGFVHYHCGKLAKELPRIVTAPTQADGLPDEARGKNRLDAWNAMCYGVFPFMWDNNIKKAGTENVNL